MDLRNDEYICRLCTVSGTNHQPIFNSIFNSIADKINKCLPIVIRADDKLPSHICCECFNALNISDKLVTQSIQAEKVLRERLRTAECQVKTTKIVQIKQEEDSNIENDTNETDVAQSLLCGICEIKFVNIDAFDEHMEKFHFSKWACSICHEDFKTSERLLQHKHKEHYDNFENTEEKDESDISDHQSSDDENEAIDIKEENMPSVSKILRSETEEKKDLICNICTVTIQTKALMVLHEKFHQPRMMICCHCSGQYPSPYDLFIHKQTVHNNYKGQLMRWFCENCERLMSSTKILKKHENCKKIRFECKYCKRSFNRKKEFYDHRKQNHFEEMSNDPHLEKLTCPTCHKSFVDEFCYKYHLRVHITRDTGKYKCKHCGKTFLGSVPLKAHEESIHDRLPKYHCKVCTKTFCNRRNLQTHQKRHLRQICKECGEQFENVREHNQHLEIEHHKTRTQGKWHCDECGKRFPKLRLWEDHKNIHSGKTPHVCKICSQTFRTYTARWSHEKKHDSGGYYCDYCKQKYINKSNLRRHVMYHLSPDDWEYKCASCTTKFPRVSLLKAHIRKHDRMGAYKCDVCNIEFVHKRNMLRHKRLHITDNSGIKDDTVRKT